MTEDLRQNVDNVEKMNQRRKELGYTVDPVAEVQRINNAR
jgi:hypothetical protein